MRILIYLEYQTSEVKESHKDIICIYFHVLQDY